MQSIQTDYRRHASRARRTPLALGALLLGLSPLALAQQAVEPLAAVRAAAEAAVRSELPQGPGEAEVTAGALDERLRLPHCGAPLSARLTAGATLQARNTVGVSCEQPRWTLYVPVTVESRIAVLILKHPVARDARLAPEDVAVETRKVAGLITEYLSDSRQLRGRSARRPLAAGTTLSADMFVPDVVVHRGQDITLVASSATFEVRAAGRALADAPAGGRLKVQNLSSMKVVEGQVESADIVRVAQ